MGKRVNVQRTEKERIELLKKWREHPEWSLEEAARQLKVRPLHPPQRFSELLAYCRGLEEFVLDKPNPHTQETWVERFIAYYSINSHAPGDYSSRSRGDGDSVEIFSGDGDILDECNDITGGGCTNSSGGDNISGVQALVMAVQTPVLVVQALVTEVVFEVQAVVLVVQALVAVQALMLVGQAVVLVV
ncbi:hypothetical protein PI125_g23124 [Phytophthora idaei]|nr:hypothetical protein PI125_g23124 [Phytophthora idaei]KAG3148412.1 hypothetical protein PI126_g12448 [Phytophthora idaei]